MRRGRARLGRIPPSGREANRSCPRRSSLATTGVPPADRCHAEVCRFALSAGRPLEPRPGNAANRAAIDTWHAPEVPTGAMPEKRPEASSDRLSRTAEDRPSGQAEVRACLRCGHDEATADCAHRSCPRCGRRRFELLGFRVAVRAADDGSRVHCPGVCDARGDSVPKRSLVAGMTTATENRPVSHAHIGARPSSMWRTGRSIRRGPETSSTSQRYPASEGHRDPAIEGLQLPCRCPTSAQEVGPGPSARVGRAACGPIIQIWASRRVHAAS